MPNVRKNVRRPARNVSRNVSQEWHMLDKHAFVLFLYCFDIVFYIVFITFSRPVTATTTAAVTARATAAATQSQSQPLQQSQLYCGVQNRGKTPPPKDSIKRKPNVRSKWAPGVAGGPSLFFVDFFQVVLQTPSGNNGHSQGFIRNSNDFSYESRLGMKAFDRVW